MVFSSGCTDLCDEVFDEADLGGMIETAGDDMLGGSSGERCDLTLHLVGETSLASFDVGNGLYENAVLKFFDNANVERPQVSLCFSGRGGTYITVGGVAARLAGPVSFSVTNKNGNITGLVRRVFVPPNGAARIAL